jgi:hypothetical protein
MVFKNNTKYLNMLLFGLKLLCITVIISMMISCNTTNPRSNNGDYDKLPNPLVNVTNFPTFSPDTPNGVIQGHNRQIVNQLSEQSQTLLDIFSAPDVGGAEPNFAHFMRTSQDNITRFINSLSALSANIGGQETRLIISRIGNMSNDILFRDTMNAFQSGNYIDQRNWRSTNNAENATLKAEAEVNFRNRLRELEQQGGPSIPETASIPEAIQALRVHLFKSMPEDSGNPAVRNSILQQFVCTARHDARVQDLRTLGLTTVIGSGMGIQSVDENESDLGIVVE